MTKKAVELVVECQRLSESCLYTSTSFYIWLRRRRQIRTVFVVVPLILGSLASWQLLTESNLDSIRTLLSVATFLVGLMPSIYSGLKFDDHLEECTHAATAFKNLQDRFRQLALVSSRKSFAEFEKEFGECRAALESARRGALTPPEWCFTRAQAKVKKGDYFFDVDLAGIEASTEESST
jgi:hypothetical protein